jgi:hypothetical protein
MTQIQYLIFGIFAIFFYLILVDKSIAVFFVLTSKFLRIQYERTKWIILNNPDNPINRYLIWRRSMKMAKELQKELLETL